MENLKSWLLPQLKRYRVELTLLIIAATIVITSFLFAVSSAAGQPSPDRSVPAIPATSTNTNPDLIVDIGGAVNKPDAYSLPKGARLKDALSKAGGLSKQADSAYFSRQFNLAQILNDQEKIYIPSYNDTGTIGISPIISRSGVTPAATISSSLKTNINLATTAELDNLSGIGSKTVEKIISGRPYGSIDELVKKGILGQTAFDKIKSMLTVD